MYKGFDDLIDAVAACSSAGTPVDLTLIGEGRHRAELEARAYRRGIANQVTFTGQLPPGQAIRDHLDRADLFVLASKTEGLPRVMIEAMARGLPCIGTSVGGIPELLLPEDLVPPGQPAALAGVIATVVADAARMSRMSAANLEKAREYRDSALDARRGEFLSFLRHATEEWVLRLHRGRS